jgi:hypothetical protein
MSDRSVVYLALGRPVVLQDTDWTNVIAPREGMLTFHGTQDCTEVIFSIEARQVRVLTRADRPAAAIPRKEQNNALLVPHLPDYRHHRRHSRLRRHCGHGR